MKALLVASLFVSTMAVQAGPQAVLKKTPTPVKAKTVAAVPARPETLKSGPQPDGRVIITAQDLNRTGSDSVAGALRNYPSIFIRSR